MPLSSVITYETSALLAEQSKVVGEKTIVVLHASKTVYQVGSVNNTSPLDPISGEPVARKSGSMTSSTATETVVVAIFPEASSEVKVTKTVVPASEQSKMLGVTVSVGVPSQLSDDVATSEKNNIPFPAAFNVTVGFKDVTVITGSRVSTTIISVVVVLDALFEGLVTVKVTVLEPKSSQSKVLGEIEYT